MMIFYVCDQLAITINFLYTILSHNLFEKARETGIMATNGSHSQWRLTIKQQNKCPGAAITINHYKNIAF